ncbi:nucleotidyltransferase family protein [Paraglaciecola sp. L3A3]|uniref:nucleotidyltransferase family protein n=1 Tax=Paraglaciecola sp. L3A3 TaxID=2686358 RepID=UPI00131AF884|nr:nucleotidyltransferase family protein [Paraglaciecola sp. L3A3]
MSTTVILLAAGQSKRFGGIKQLAEVGPRALINHCLMQFFSNNKLVDNIDELFVILGSNRDKIQAVIPDYIKTHFVENWSLGMGQSIAESVKNLSISNSHIFIILADQIAISTEIVNKMLLTSTVHPSKIVAAQYSQQLGVPAIFPAQYLNQLQNLTGDKGARNIIQQNIQNVVSLSIPEAAYDIDTPEDLLMYIQQTK